MQSTSHIFMIRPASFGFNEETAATNAFQQRTEVYNLNELARAEFDNAVKILRTAGVDVIVFKDTTPPAKPDAIFPNNWISLHEDGTAVLYPMCTPNRRSERRLDIIEQLCDKYDVKRIVDLSYKEQSNRFLEGTGSVVFDHINKVAYACLSPRTNKELFEKLCLVLDYEDITFHAQDKREQEIYHTNVMMCIAEKFAVICLDSIRNASERNYILSKLKTCNLEVIDISFSQMENFAGNMLGLKSQEGNHLIALSQNAFDSLSKAQKDVMARHCRFVPLAIPTIEMTGGGSARCMIAEVFCARS